MIAQTTTRLAATANATRSLVVKGITKPVRNYAAVFKYSPGNSFSSFKEYREVAKSYGPLSAALATKRKLANVSTI
ncbi:Dpi8p NDAI_0G06210 [Naumovozyma dairenensis CBS 421]|uniref:Uncharacterized protein n=1 Tax=Naumovozyma dairenensis (strain ATCC 10597 / BCRC 20456 / CBS 421 / NBRC 0211 / NRRL Y-12639) TaxID=1071378 RepID=J7REQ9_NAUDC|nr:hypothetical protein NDAI_0G06210 [Naumovozyma dairenensis CBS 421]CCK73604.1 hypothetical protein NDAI_0G06210 [Naumovozyma dairenensis CBS 421]